MRGGRHAALGCAAAVALAVAGCGGGPDPVQLPEGIVAMVGRTEITEANFNGQLKRVVADSATSGKPLRYTPPRFEACVAQRRRTANMTAGGARETCRLEYQQVRIAAMRYALQDEWTKQEAARRTIKTSAVEFNDAIDRQKRARFKTEAGYRRYLRDTGRRDEEFREAVRNQLLAQKITLAVGSGAPDASARQVSRYYATHKKEFARPARRNVRVVLTRTEAQARTALRALRAGQSWAQVAKRYSIDPQTKGKGGALPEYVRAQGSPDLDKAVFAARAGALSGPLETQFGWYVFVVEKVLPASQQTFAQARAQIKGTLTYGMHRKAIETFGLVWDGRFTTRSVCDDDFKIAECRNGPASNPPPPSLPSGAQAPSQQVPQ